MYIILDSYSFAQICVSVERMLVCGSVEQAAAVQLVLQIYPGLVAHHVPTGAQQFLLQSTNDGTGSTTPIR